MRGWRLVVVVVWVASCGRIDFDPVGGDATPFVCPGTYEGPACLRVDAVTKAEWADGEAACEQDGGHLVAIESPQRLADVTSLMLSHTLSSAWIGTTELVQTGTWLTVTGGAAYLDWDIGQPDNNGGPEHCIAIIDGKMHDDDCPSLNEYVCQFDGKRADPSAF